MKRRRRNRFVESARAILRLAFLAAAIALLFPRTSQPQAFHIVTPMQKAVPMYERMGEIMPDMRVYERWWKEIALCQGFPLPAEHLRIRWIQVNAEWFYDKDHDLPDSTGKIGVAIGKSFLALRIIMLALPYRYDEEVVKHEMTHFLILWAGEKLRPGEDHPRLHFDGHCGVYKVYKGGNYREGR